MKNSKGLTFEIIVYLVLLVSLFIIWLGTQNVVNRSNSAFEKSKIVNHKLHETLLYDSIPTDIKEGLASVKSESEFTYYASSNLYGIVTLIGLVSFVLLIILLIRNTLRLLHS